MSKLNRRATSVNVIDEEVNYDRLAEADYLDALAGREYAAYATAAYWHALALESEARALRAEGHYMPDAERVAREARECAASYAEMVA
jgi:hypothetical protein